MLPFGCNTSQPIPNILADTFFSKNGQVKFWPDNENVGSVLKKSDISLLQLVVNRNERCQCLYPRIFAQIFHFSHFRGDSSNRVARNCDFSFFLKKIGFITILQSFFEKIMSKPKPIYTSENIAVLQSQKLPYFFIRVARYGAFFKT